MPRRIFQFLTALTKDRRGATAIEYGLIVAFVAIVIVAAVTLVGTDLSNFFGSATNSI